MYRDEPKRLVASTCTVSRRCAAAGSVLTRQCYLGALCLGLISPDRRRRLSRLERSGASTHPLSSGCGSDTNAPPGCPRFCR